MSGVYQQAEYRAMYRAAHAGDYAAKCALADWLAERGVGDHAQGELFTAIPFRMLDIWRFGRGRGSGSGRGIGSGIGRGSGRGRGSGSGSGRGRGSGIGRGRGSKPFEGEQMEPGKAYLIHGGDWHTFVGRVVRQCGPMLYELEKVSKIDTNNGDCWHELAAGDERLRKACTYFHFTTPAVLPLTIAAFEWAGRVPQEWEG